MVRFILWVVGGIFPIRLVSLNNYFVTVTANQFRFAKLFIMLLFRAVEKIESIRAEFPLLEPTLQPNSFTDIDSIMPNCDIIFDHFEQLKRDDLMKIISVMNKTTCVSDPFPTKLLMSHVPAIVDIIRYC